MVRERVVVQESEVVDDDVVVTTTPPTAVSQTARTIYYIMGVVNVLLLLRLIFQAFGANRGSPVVALIYALSGALLAPFRGIFGIAAAGESVIDPAIFVAMIIYALLAKGLVELLYLLTRRRVTSV
jgi:YggT family protein